MAVTFLLDGVRPNRVTVGCSPLAELMACLHVLTEQDHHPRQQQWARATSDGLPPALVPRLAQFAPLWARYRCRLLLPLDAPLDLPLQEELDRLDSLDLDVFAEYIAHALVGVQHLGDFSDVLRDREQQRTLLRNAERRSFMREELADLLFKNAAGMRAELLEVLAACRAAFFDEYWQRAEGRLRAASRTLRQRKEHEPLSVVFASLGPASRLQHAPERVVYDKLQHSVINLAERRCLIVPSLQSFPHVLIKSDARWPVVVHTPLSPIEDAKPSSLSEVRLRLLILTDPQRLVLCRHLAGEAITTSELARRTGMTAPQVSRHIGRLRDTGLVTSTPDGRMVRHRLSTEVIARLGSDLLSAILR